MSKKPSVFIGSSREGLQVAEVLNGLLSSETESYLWKEGIFRASSYPLEEIEKQVRSRDFAVLVGTADDKLEKRNQVAMTVRDNISFEIGLFMGALGRRRVFLVIPTGDLHLPTDLTGWTTIRYDKERFERDFSEWTHVMQQPTFQILQAIREEWGKQKQQEAAQERKIRESEQFKAFTRLLGAITDLRDILIMLQGDLVNSFDDSRKFSESKRRIATKTQQLALRFSDDANLLGVEQEFDYLVAVTTGIIVAMPYPEEILMSEDKMKSAGLELGARIVKDPKFWESPGTFAHAAVTEEVQHRLDAIGIRYKCWWEESHHNIDTATNQLQSALMRRMVPRLLLGVDAQA